MGFKKMTSNRRYKIYNCYRNISQALKIDFGVYIYLTYFFTSITCQVYKGKRGAVILVIVPCSGQFVHRDKLFSLNPTWIHRTEGYYNYSFDGDDGYLITWPGAIQVTTVI